MGNSKLQPNTTQIPNYFIDELMPQLTPTEFSVLMVIARQTYGWHKESDRLSYTQLEERTGAARKSISTALKSLREKKLITTTADGQDLSYSIRIGVKTTLVTSVKITPATSVKITPTKETNTKEINTLKSINRANPDVERVLKEFSEETGLSQPSDRAPRNWAFLFAKHKGVSHFQPCLRYLQNDRKLTITKLETVFRQFPLYARDVLKHKVQTRKLTEEEEYVKEMYERRDRVGS